MNSVVRDNVRPDTRNDNHSSVVSDLMSLIDHMQASMKLLEGAIASKLPLGTRKLVRMSSFWTTSRPVI